MNDRDWTTPLDKRTEGGWYGCEAPDGWARIILDADDMLAYIDPDYTILQIKQKFGSLRYYFATSKTGVESDIMHAIARNAEQASMHVCEDCGRFGEIRGKTWFRTLCDEHYNEPNTGE